MMDFSTMKWGVIETDEGTIIAIKGTFFGPFNNEELRGIVTKWRRIKSK